MKNVLLRTLCIIIPVIGFYKSAISQATALTLSGNCEKTTVVYATKDTNVLRLDKYVLKGDDKIRPCVFFLYGGAFRGGIRDNKAYYNFFNALVQRGFVVISIDYRLGMKNIKGFSFEPAALKKAVEMAVEDLYDATTFTVKHAKEWNIDTGKIVISGSSAGALTVLKAEYENDNQTAISKKLPQGFRYAGVMSFAGAIFSTNESDLAWSKVRPCPILMFHGSSDNIVPYDHFQMNNMGIYGSKYIALKLDSLQTPYWLYTITGGGHNIATSPMNTNQQEILQFLDDMVIGKRNTVLRTEYREAGQMNNTARKLELQDFIRSNSK